MLHMRRILDRFCSEQGLGIDTRDAIQAARFLVDQDIKGVVDHIMLERELDQWWSNRKKH